MVYNYSEVEHYRLHSIKVLKNRIRKDSIRKYKEKYNKKRGSGITMMHPDDYVKSQEFKDALLLEIENNKRYQFLIGNAREYSNAFLREYDQCGSKEKKKEEVSKYIRENFMEGDKYNSLIARIRDSIDNSIARYFETSMLLYESYADGYKHIETLNLNRMEEFCDNYHNYIQLIIIHIQVKGTSLMDNLKSHVFADKFMMSNKKFVLKNNHMEPLYQKVRNDRKMIIEPLAKKYSLAYALSIMNKKNKHYKGMLSDYLEYEENKEKIHSGLLDRIPDNYIDLFPLAREMKRKFILHVGPTNSGKTYNALCALKKADKGIYLGPLRLLAFEQYERMNADGCLCSLRTGEEKQEVDGATHYSSTIEMLNFSEHYDVAVIDEAQLISDPYRGGAWTNAILGVLADEIHICVAPEAEKIICDIISSCGDQYKVHHHERNNPLVMENERFDFDNGIKPGDALIVFSKKSVHSVANDLKDLGITCSIIYGSLPYDVRQNEAHKFQSGETDVLVSTDAIGLGMNLPIRRVVLLEQKKYDGKTLRPLLPSEVKQIAGRAGRFGMFENGLVNTYAQKRYIRGCLSEPNKKISSVYLKFPQNLVDIDAKLSNILRQWEKMEVNKGFKKSDISHEMKLCKLAEQYTDDKHLIYEFITIPFEDENRTLLDLWIQMLINKIENHHLSFHTISPLTGMDIEHMGLQDLESAYKVCDLIYYYNEKFEDSIESEYVMEEKMNISKAIIKLLDEQKLPIKKCKDCGKPLVWNFRYSVCQKCYENHDFFW